MPQSWFEFKNSSDNKSVEISIYDVIGSYAVSAKSFIAELKRAGNKPIKLRIHSPGGNILEGNAIYNALQRHPASIDVSIDGIAASMASVVAMAGDTIEIAENGFIMIHNPTASAYGESKDLRKMADVADKMKAGIVAAYQKKTGLKAEKISELMDGETWMTAAEAIENKFADFIGDKVDAKNSFDLSQFENLPAPLGASRVDTTSSFNSMAKETSEAQIKRLEDEAKNFQTEKTELTNKITKLEGEKTELSNKVTALEGEKTELSNKVATLEGELKTANDKVTKLEGENKSAEERARELAAASGVTATAKGKEAAEGGADNGKELYEQYDKLMKDGKSKEAAEFYAEHEKAIEKYGQSTLKKD